MTTAICPDCNGKKKVKRFLTVRICETCRGTGHVTVQAIMDEDDVPSESHPFAGMSGPSGEVFRGHEPLQTVSEATMFEAAGG